MDYSDYRYLRGFVTHAYSYIEESKVEQTWVDSQNCYIHIIPENPYSKINGKNYWIIEPMVPSHVEVINNEEEYNKYVKYLVTWSSIETDEYLEWDFNLHKPIRNESNIS